MTIERVVKGTNGDITYYVVQREDNKRCAIGLHGLTKQLRADWVGYFSRVRRFRCLCGEWEWVEYNGSIVERQKAPTPEEDERSRALEAEMQSFLAEMRV